MALRYEAAEATVVEEENDPVVDDESEVEALAAEEVVG